jgi:hypothetical protein
MDHVLVPLCAITLGSAMIIALPPCTPCHG